MPEQDDPLATAVRRLAHDLRGPITSIAGNTKFLLAGSELSPDARSALEDVVEATMSMNRQLQDLVDICRWDAGLLPAVLADFAVGTLSGRVLSDLAPRLERRRQRVVCGDALESSVRADGELARRALQAVLESALARSAAGDTVSLRVVAGPSETRVLVEDGGAFLAAADRGVILGHAASGRLAMVLSHRERGLVFARAAMEASGGRLEIEATTANAGNRACLVFRRP